MTDTFPQRSRRQVVGDIRRYLLAAEALPTPHGTAAKLIEIARDERASLDDSVRVLRSDPALTGFVLRAARAARFGATPAGLDLKGAVQRLGLDVIRAHALALSLISQPARPHCPGFDYTRFWIGALHKAVLTEALVRHGVARAAGDAFSLGLLADVGRLAFATASPRAYATVLAQTAGRDDELAARERTTFGFDHHELSAVLLADWQLPIALADVVYWQRDPEGGGATAGSTQHRLAGVLQLAEALSRGALDAGHDGGDDALALAALRAAILGLEADTMHQILADSLPALRDWTGLVGLPVPLLHT
ncbi:MAG TPA: HDOD domain-containing protein [Rhodocyclaceae bacterium]|nr:HDOD domain-containing protein [Rhodocyclaceae bacterium]